MNYFNRFKRHPPVPQDDYFAQLSAGTVDLSSDNIRAALDATQNGAETFPNLALGDLQIFWETLQQETVIPTGEGLPLGTITYAQPGRKGTVALTGLSFEQARIDPESENFVIETIQSTLNDPDTRNSDANYEQMKFAFQQLISSALKYTTYTEDDMPQIPTDEAYEKALSENLDIIIEPRRVVQQSADIEQATAGADQETNVQSPASDEKTSTVGVDTEVISVPQQQKSVDTSTPSNTQEMEPSIALIPGVAPAEPEHVSKTTIEKPVAAITNSTNGPIATTSIAENGRTSKSGTDELVEAVEQFQLEIPQLPVDDAFAKMSLEPADANYVKSELAKETVQSNQFLRINGEKFEAGIRQKLLAIVDTKSFQKQLNQLVDSNWQDKINQDLKVESEQRFNKQFADRKKLLEDDRVDQEAEAERQYKQKLRDIKRASDEAITTLHDDLAQQTEQTLKLSQQQAISEQQMYINEQITALKKTVRQAQDVKALEIVNTFKPEATSTLTAIMNAITKELAERKQVLEKEHQKAFDEVQQRDEQANKKVDLVGQQKRLSILQESEAKLSEQVHRVSADLETANTKNDQLTETNQQLQEKINSLAAQEQVLRTQSQKSENDDLFKAALIGMKKPEPKSKAPVWILSIISVLGVVALGGGAAYTITQQQQNQHQLAHLESVIQKQDAQLKSAQNKPSHQSTHTSKADSSKFKVLDESLDSGSLGVYERSFKDQNLDTEDRTLKTGKLLIQNGQKDDAWVLAEKNHGHNDSLIDLLKGTSD